MSRVFISYSSEDRPWAQKLFDDLKAANLDPFFDQKKLTAGGVWDEQLSAELKTSRDLVVLWSKNAQLSPWVAREISEFTTARNLTAPTKKPSVILVLLDDQRHAHSNRQAINNAALKAAYPQGPDTMPQAEWKSIISEIEQASRTDDSLAPVNLVALAMTDEEAKKIDLDEAPAFLDGAGSLKQVLANIGISHQSLAANYGQRRMDWRPLGSGQTFATLMETVRTEINALPGVRPFCWVPVSEAFWSTKAIQDVIYDLVSKPTVIAIDPLSLYAGTVFGRLYQAQARGCFNSREVCVVVLPPFPLGAAAVAYRAVIKDLQPDMYTEYYQPGLRGLPFATCGLNFGDEKDVSRWVLSGLGQQLRSAREGAPSNAYTSLGPPAR